MILMGQPPGFLPLKNGIGAGMTGNLKTLAGQQPQMCRLAVQPTFTRNCLAKTARSTVLPAVRARHR